MEKIKEAFKAYFEGDNIELPQEIEKKGKISKLPRQIWPPP